MKRILNFAVILLGTLATFTDILAQRDLVICLDTSGSMRYRMIPDPANPTMDGNCATDLLPLTAGGDQDPDTRYRIAREALIRVSGSLLEALFNANSSDFGNVYAIRFPKPPAGGVAGTATVQSLLSAGGSGLNPFTNGVRANEIVDFFTTNLDIDCSAFGTPMKNALMVSSTALNPTCASNNTLSKMILLIADGKPTDGLDVTTVNTEISRTNDNIVCRHVGVNAIGIGLYTANDYFGLLQRIALLRQGTCGASGCSAGNFFGYAPGPFTSGTWGGGTPFQTFLSTDASYLGLIKALEASFVLTFGYTAVADPVDSLSPGQRMEIPFRVTNLDTSLIFTLHGSDTTANARISFRITPPNAPAITEESQDLPDNYYLGREPGSVAVIIKKRFIAQNQGQWKLELSAPASNAGIVYYLYSLYTKSLITEDYGLRDDLPVTGDVLQGSVTLNLQNTTLKNLTVTASYAAPQNWLGNWSASQKLSPAEMILLNDGLRAPDGSLLPWASDLSLFDRKIIYLHNIKNKTFVEKFSTSTIAVPLYDDGQHGDGANGDGIFNNQIHTLVVPGLYEVLYRVKGTTPDSLPVEREYLLHKFVEVGVQNNWKDSIIKFKPLPNFGAKKRAQVIIVPKDRFGNIPLPGLANAIQVLPDSSRGTMRNAIVDHLDGTYSQEILYEKTFRKPKVYVRFQDKLFPVRQVVYIPAWGAAASGQKIFLDKDLPFDDPLIGGVSFSRNLSSRWSLGVSADFGKLKNSTSEQGNLVVAGLDFKYWLGIQDRFRPFLSIGGGYMRFSGFSNKDQAPTASLGGGLCFLFSERFGFQLEARDLAAFGLFGQSTTHNMQAAFGLNLNWF
ncbi:hypothetical protein L0337_40995 [candidate division KSB1 bacterium]|nr:hypothetical protein [candidate division KSB1 bacterium]